MSLKRNKIVILTGGKNLSLRMVFFILLSFPVGAFAQDDLESLVDEAVEEKSTKVIATFKTTRLINAHTIETVKGHTLDFRVDHKFGDIAGAAGGFHTFYGFDNVADVRIAFEYGINERLTIGSGRSKGTPNSPVKGIWDGLIKYRLLQQTTNNKMPLSITFFANTAFTSMKASADSTSEAHFQNLAHRFSYVTQLIIGRKFSENFSFQINPLYLHRNLVRAGDENGIFALGAGGRFKLTKRFALIADYYHIFSDFRDNNQYHNPLGAGFEIETGGHVFHLVFTNSKGILENQYIPYTQSDWLDGEFRFSFKISRVFSIK